MQVGGRAVGRDQLDRVDARFGRDEQSGGDKKEPLGELDRGDCDPFGGALELLMTGFEFRLGSCGIGGEAVPRFPRNPRSTRRARGIVRGLAGDFRRGVSGEEVEVALRDLEQRLVCDGGLGGCRCPDQRSCDLGQHEAFIQIEPKIGAAADE